MNLLSKILFNLLHQSYKDEISKFDFPRNEVTLDEN